MLAADELVLLYPEWDTTSHSATNLAVELAGLHVVADEHELPWRRDPFDVRAFHITVPNVASSLLRHFDYPEGVLLWMSVDARLRNLTYGRYGLDGFAARPFAAHAQPAAVSTYSFEDVCATLNSVAKRDRKGYLADRLSTHDTRVVMSGLESSGWRLTAVRSRPKPSCRMRRKLGRQPKLLHRSSGTRERYCSKRCMAWAKLPSWPEAREQDREIEQSGVHICGVAESGCGGVLYTNSPYAEASGMSREVLILYAGPLRYPVLERIPVSPDWLSILLTSR